MCKVFFVVLSNVSKYKFIVANIKINDSGTENLNF